MKLTLYCELLGLVLKPLNMNNMLFDITRLSRANILARILKFRLC